MRHASTILALGIWLALMGTLVQREQAARGLDGDALPAIPQLGPDTDETTWFGIYQHDRKIGWARRRERRLPDGWHFEDETRLVLAMLGTAQPITTRLDATAAPDRSLRRFHFLLVSPAATFAASGASDGTAIDVRYGPEGRQERLRLPLDGPVHLTSMLRPRVAAAWPPPGARFSHAVLNPMSMRHEPVRITVDGHETLDGAETLRIVEQAAGLSTTAWIDRQGQVVRERGALGLVLERESAETARAEVDDAPPVDLALATRVPFVGRIDDPRHLAHLTLRVEGAAAARIPHSPPGQRVAGAVVRVDRRPGLAGPAPDSAELATLRRPSPFIESDDAAIIARAQAIVAGALDDRDKARRIVDWVNAHLVREPSLTIPSARDVLRTGRGDCNEHAVLVAALARAAGLPTRVAAGVAWATDGFYYHAWNEIWLDGWVTADAVFAQLPADATHLKLLDGGPERHVQLAEIVGHLTLTRLTEDDT